MKLLFPFLLLFISCSVNAQMFSQDNTEIWGYPQEYSEKEFMDYLNKNKVTACTDDLNKIGFPDSFVYGAYSDGMKYLITLREIPHYSFNTVVKVKKIYPPNYVISMGAVGVANEENYYAFKAYIPTQLGDTVYVNSLNWDVNSRLVGRIFGFIKSKGEKLDQDSCINFIRHSESLLFKKAALLSYLGSIKKKDDLIKLFPLVMDKDVGGHVADIFSSGLKYHPLQKEDWANEMFVQCLNHPDPFLVKNLMTTYQKHGFPKEYADKVTKNGSTTIKEILNGRLLDFPDLEKVTTGFLIYLTEENISGKKEWLTYLDSQSNNGQANR